MKTTIKRLVRKSKAAIIGYKVYDNWRISRRFKLGAIGSNLGSTHASKTIDDSLSYIDLQFEDYLKYGTLTREQLRGKTILEIGCGDNVGVALRFLAEGAARVICVDKFYSHRDPLQERRIYQELRTRLDDEARSNFDRVIRIEHQLEIDQSRLECCYGKELEQLADELLSEGIKVDVIVSRAVLEEIYDPKPTLLAADRVLKEGGLMIHKIDLRDYDMFSGTGMNPLTFLTIPEWVYRRMASDSGLPNRRLAGYYRQLLADLGYDARLLVSSIIGVGEVRPHKEHIAAGIDYGAGPLALIEDIRSKLTPEFANLPVEDLLTDGIFIVARKTAARTR